MFWLTAAIIPIGISFFIICVAGTPKTSAKSFTVIFSPISAVFCISSSFPFSWGWGCFLSCCFFGFFLPFCKSTSLSPAVFVFCFLIFTFFAESSSSPVNSVSSSGLCSSDTISSTAFASLSLTVLIWFLTSTPSSASIFIRSLLDNFNFFASSYTLIFAMSFTPWYNLSSGINEFQYLPGKAFIQNRCNRPVDFTHCPSKPGLRTEDSNRYPLV